MTIAGSGRGREEARLRISSRVTGKEGSLLSEGMKTSTRPDPRKTSKAKPGPYRRQYDANSVALHHRRMRRALVEDGTPRWMEFASGYDRLVLR